MQYGRDPYASQSHYFEARHPQWDRHDERAGGYGPDRQRYQGDAYRQTQQGQYQQNFGPGQYDSPSNDWAFASSPQGGQFDQPRYASQPHYDGRSGYGFGEPDRRGYAQWDQGYSGQTQGQGYPGSSAHQGSLYQQQPGYAQQSGSSAGQSNYGYQSPPQHGYGSGGAQHGWSGSQQQDWTGQQRGYASSQGRHGYGQESGYGSQGYAQGQQGSSWRQGRYAQGERGYQPGPFGGGPGGGSEAWASGGGGAATAQRSSYAGRGPKSYSRSDDRIQEDINERLTHTDVDCSDIDVTVKDGQVRLTGEVGSRNCKFEAEHIADSVSGVKDVKNELRVDQSRHENAGQPSGASSSKNGAGGSEKSDSASPSSSVSSGSRLATAGSRR